MIEFRGYATTKECAAVTLQGALIKAAENKAYERGRMEGFQEGYELGRADVRNNQWAYMEKLAHEFATGVRS